MSQNRFLWKITKFYMKCRLVMFVIQNVAFNLVRAHQSDAFNPRTNLSNASSDKIVRFFLGGFEHWDAKHFFFIAENGYVLESSLAFFPGFPILIRLISFILRTIISIDKQSSFLLSAIFINLLFNLFNTFLIYILTYQTFSDERISFIASSLFCFNPATVFFLAPYTESFFFFSIMCALLLLNKRKNEIFPAIVFSLSSFIRSNGIINIIFIFFYNLTNIRRFNSFRVNLYYFILQIICKSVFHVVLIILPFILFQLYAFFIFCSGSYYEKVSYGLEEDFAIPQQYLIAGKQKPTWCSEFFSYSSVQRKYWNVGFMKYWRFKQVPNFLLAFPVLSLSLRCLFSFFTDWRLRTDPKKSLKPRTTKIPIIAYHIHLAFLSLFALFFMNIQVSTRLLFSATPLLYWYSSISILKNCDEMALRYLDDFNFKAFYWYLIKHPIVMYFVLYSLAGTALFSCGLPWT